jgi:hypothetical protein
MKKFITKIIILFFINSINYGIIEPSVNSEYEIIEHPLKDLNKLHEKEINNEDIKKQKLQKNKIDLRIMLGISSILLVFFGLCFIQRNSEKRSKSHRDNGKQEPERRENQDAIIKIERTISKQEIQGKRKKNTRQKKTREVETPKIGDEYEKITQQLKREKDQEEERQRQERLANQRLKTTAEQQKIIKVEEILADQQEAEEKERERERQREKTRRYKEPEFRLILNGQNLNQDITYHPDVFKPKSFFNLRLRESGRSGYIGRMINPTIDLNFTTFQITINLWINISTQAKGYSKFFYLKDLKKDSHYLLLEKENLESLLKELDNINRSKEKALVLSLLKCFFKQNKTFFYKEPDEYERITPSSEEEDNPKTIPFIFEEEYNKEMNTINFEKTYNGKKYVYKTDKRFSDTKLDEESLKILKEILEEKNIEIKNIDHEWNNPQDN